MRETKDSGSAGNDATAASRVKRFAAYLRVSTNEQGERDSIQVTQPKAIRQYVESIGGRVVHQIEDVQSGMEENRPGWARVLELARAGEIDAVAAWRMDRFGREPADAFPYMRELARLDVELHSATEGNDPFLQGILLLLANQESRNTAKRVRAVQADMVAEGKWVSRAPLGYDAAPSERGAGTLLVANGKAPLVRFLFRRFAETHSNNAVRCEARERFGFPLSRRALVYILRNPIYIGRLVYGREEHSKVLHRRGRRPASDWSEGEGRHEPLISHEIWARVQAILDANAKARAAVRTTTRYLLTSRVFCAACGGRMRGQKLCRYSKKDGRKLGESHLYVHNDDSTDCRPRTRSGPRADEAVRAVLMGVPFFSELSAASAMQMVADSVTLKDAGRRQERDLRAARARHEEGRKRLTYAYAVEKSIPREVYEGLLADEEQAVGAIDAELEANRGRGEDVAVAVRQRLESLRFDWDRLLIQEDADAWCYAVQLFVERVELGEETLVILKPEFEQALASIAQRRRTGAPQGRLLPRVLLDRVLAACVPGDYHLSSTGALPCAGRRAPG